MRRGLLRRASVAGRRLGIDEHSYLKRHQYVTMVVDLDTKTVLHVADDRKATSLDAYFSGLTLAERTGIEAVAMDMWDPYRTSVRHWVPDADAKIVFDRFHVMGHVLEALDQVRRKEQQVLRKMGDRRLTGTKFLWLKSEIRRTDFTTALRRTFDTLKASTLKSARAWAMKEAIRRLWQFRSLPYARRFFARWYAWATRSRLAPMRYLARTLRAHLENILTYLTHRITNAVTEGLNAKIQWIKYSSRGFRDRERFKTAIYFHCGGLDLEPR